MKYLLYGNGLNIQYGGAENNNHAILKRALKSALNPSYPIKAITFIDANQIFWLFGALYQIIPDVVNHEYDVFVFATYEKDALISFIKRYKTAQGTTMFDVGIEDYLLLYNLFMAKNGVFNPERYYIREAFKRVLAYAVYNNGKVNRIYRTFPRELKDFLSDFDEIYTTNYDTNIDTFLHCHVGHLHGSFDTLSFLYDSSSARNRMSNAPINDSYYNKRYPYLFSNIIFSFSGEEKEFTMNQAAQTNEGLKKMAEGYKHNETIRNEIDSWLGDSQDLVSHLAEAVQKRVADPEFKFDEYYPIAEFRSIKGELSILGLSPNNDTHIFKEIVDNNEIESVVFYYYNDFDKTKAERLLHGKNFECKPVKALWRSFS